MSAPIVMLRSTRLAVAGIAIVAAACGEAEFGPVPVASVLVAPDTLYVRINETGRMHASARSASGFIVHGVPVNWASADTGVASVTGEGVVTGRGYGTATIMASVDGVAGRGIIHVTGAPGVRIIAGGNATDTVDVVLPLAVEVRDARGLPLPGVMVEFAGPVPLSLTPSPWIVVGLPGSTPSSTTARSTTDGRGRAEVRVRLGMVAGNALFRVSVPTLGYRDSTVFGIRPGTATRLLVEPRDTAVSEGAMYTLRGNTADRHGNLRDESVVVTAGGNVASASAAQVTGRRFGRDSLVATAGALRATAWVSVVPRGSIAACAPSAAGGRQAGIFIMNLDGSGLTLVEPGASRRVAWLTANRLIFDIGPAERQQLFVRDVGAQQSVPFLAEAARMGLEFSASPANGGWVYFSGTGGIGVGYSFMSLFRARTSGTSLERVREASADGVPWDVSVSPDGTKIVYVIARPGATGRTDAGSAGPLEIADLTTGHVRRVNALGTSPRWSPDGSTIAFVQSGQPRLMNADGGQIRQVIAGAYPPFYELDWSPDGRFLLLSGYFDPDFERTNSLTVVEVATGLAVPIPVASSVPGLRGPVWRPQ